MTSQLRLLIVDDDADLLEPVLEVCRRFDFEVIGATSAEHALEILRVETVDAMLTDVRMQPVGGFALVEEARCLLPHLPVILWTGFWDFGDEKRAAALENIEKLEKPFTFCELEAVLTRVRQKITTASKLPSVQSLSVPKNF